jgi:hypothetical protein
VQAALDFGRSHRVEQAHRKLLRIVNDAVDVLGLVQAAGACDCSKSDLASALAGREHRHLRVEWLLAIADVAPADCRRAIVDALVTWLGLSVVPSRPLTPEERLAQLEARVAVRFGQAGVELLKETP